MEQQFQIRHSQGDRQQQMQVAQLLADAQSIETVALAPTDRFHPALLFIESTEHARSLLVKRVERDHLEILYQIVDILILIQLMLARKAAHLLKYQIDAGETALQILVDRNTTLAHLINISFMSYGIE